MNEKCVMIIYRSPSTSKSLSCDKKIQGKCEVCEGKYCSKHFDVFCRICQKPMFCESCNSENNILFVCKECLCCSTNKSFSGQKTSLPIPIPKRRK